MKVNNLVHIDVKLERIKEPFKLIEGLARGKNVLNVGAGGGVQGYLPNATEIWLHERIKKVANKIVGVDIDLESIKYAHKYGYQILNEDCETMALEEQFDIIVISDVIEHVNAPVTAVNNLMNHLADNGKLVITTPNATAGNVFIRSLIRKNINVLADHVAVYYPEHFQAICDRFNYELKAIYLFDHTDKRTILTRFKSFLFQIMTLISSRLASSMMVIIEKK